MNEHTPGLVVLSGCDVVSETDKDKVVAFASISSFGAAIAHANAKRVVACWNALADWTDEDIAFFQSLVNEGKWPERRPAKNEPAPS